MNRSKYLEDIANTKLWDVIIIGGGASGLGAAVDAAQRGYKTLLLEKNDFAKGTSSRSTKLVHGGVRYLQNGDISLVIEALKERGIMKRNAPHMVKDMSFVIPFYDWWNSPFYGLGLKVYDMMAGNLGLGPSELLNKKEINRILDAISQQGLTCVLTSLYWKENKIKCDIAIGKGKKTYDQREDVKRRDWNREKQRILKNSNR